ncbi:carboxypeptidase-like regulatory domain-containing protein [Bacteriovoracaceae bacterium]|nr:carboxypeptidase-like regulatory domain-containing protein [Bacteriovoracaceae bacterium]
MKWFSFILLFIFVSLSSCGPSGGSNMLLGNVESDGSEESSAVISYGSISGNITDAEDGATLSDVSVYILGFQTSTEVSTNSTGEFSISSAPSGERYVVLSKSGYVSQTPSATIPVNDELENYNVSLVPDTTWSQDKFVITLSWAETPADLDSYMYVPETGSTHKIWYLNATTRGDLTGDPYAQLDVDDIDGEGPETIRIRYEGGSLDYNGVYRYYIHNLTGTPSFTDADAVVRIYRNQVLWKTYTACSGDDSLDWWHVFDLTGSTGSIAVGNDTCENSEPSDPN